MAFEDSVVDGFIVCGRVELEFVGRKDGVDVRFPEVTGFGVTLESVLNGKDERAVDGSTETVVVPIGIGIVDGDKSGNGRRS